MLITLRETSSAVSRGMGTGTPPGVVTRELEIPPSTVTGFITKLGGFTAVVTGLTTLFTFWFSDIPLRRDQARTAKLDILQRALQVEDSAQRRASLKLLLQLDLIDNKWGELGWYIDWAKAIPHWVPLASTTPSGSAANSATRKASDAAVVESLARKPGGDQPPPPPRR
jgi:hypothetical protein